MGNVEESGFLPNHVSDGTPVETNAHRHARPLTILRDLLADYA
jgi:hypothetical protein